MHLCRPKKVHPLMFLSLFCLTATTGLKSQDIFPSRQLTTDPAQQGFPTWSPDGKQIIYQHSGRDASDGKNGLWKVVVDGKEGEAVQICSELAEHPKWSPDGRHVVFDADTGNSVKMVSALGGEPVSILPESFQIMSGGLPCWSPDGSHIAFLEGGTRSLCVKNMRTNRVSRIFRKNGLIPLPGGWSPDGKTIYISLMERPSRQCTIWKVSADGSETTQITGHMEGHYRHLALTPDGSLLLYAVYDGSNMGFWIMPAEGGNSIQIVSHPGFNDGPAWSPDGSRLAFNSTRAGNHDVWIMEVDIDAVKRRLKEIYH